MSKEENKASVVSDRFLIKNLENRIVLLEQTLSDIYNGNALLLEHETTAVKYKMVVTGLEGSETITLIEV